MVESEVRHEMPNKSSVRLLNYNVRMTRRTSFRSAPLGERVCAGLVVLLGHGLLLVRLANAPATGAVDGGDDRQGAMEVTFITLPKVASRAPSFPPPLKSPVSEIVEAPKLRSSSAQSSGAIENSLVEQSEHLASKRAGNEGEQEAGANEDLKGQYEAAIRAAIQRKWQQLGQSSVRGKCILQFTQSAGGAVTTATTDDCDLPTEERARLEAAVLMAQPLPYKGFESVFTTEIEVRF